MKKVKLLFVLLFISLFTYSQNNFTLNVTGIKENDSIRIIMQNGLVESINKWVPYDSSGTSVANFSLSTGQWAIIVDATGYTFPAATVIEIPQDISAQLELTPLLGEDYHYTWQDDDSYAGHATQVYINEPSKLVVLNDTLVVPSDYSSIKLRNEFGIVLTDDNLHWSSEDSYKLYTTLKSLPITSYGEGREVNFSTGENLNAIFSLTEDEQYRDLTIEYKNGVKYVTISRSAFTYANPQIVTLDGLKGKFYSKRLYHAIVNYYTDFATNKWLVNHIAQEKFGVRFMESTQETQDIMGEDKSNFQEFFDEEKIEILAMFEEMPEGFHKIEGLKYLVRRINGQDNPVYPQAAAIAWGGKSTIEFMSKAFNGVDSDNVRRLILHEKAHFLWFYTFDEQTKNDWIELGGWFLDPTSGSGWSTYNTTEFVSAYAHDNNPNEDMAESIAAYITNPEILQSRSMRKYEFIRDRIMHGTRYIAQIREDLTFTVYNLFPDYTYPGKVIGIELNSKGEPNGDKVVSIRVKLHSVDLEKDGAHSGYIRLSSTAGTIHDIGLRTESGNPLDSVLVGETTFTKFEKSGYWNLVSFRVFDLVGNQRYENTSTIGFKLYIENPLEDIIPPKWNYDLTMEVVREKFHPNHSTFPTEDGIEMNAVKINYSFYDDTPGGGEIRLNNPTLDDPTAQVYERFIHPEVIENDTLSNGFKNVKYMEAYAAIPDYFPSGYYSIPLILNYDSGNNHSWIYFLRDTVNFNANNINRFKDLRDSVYVSTQYPDYIPPEIDENNIHVNATPMNPEAPNGETRVDIDFLARDLSDYLGKESGIVGANIYLKDPLGVIHGYQTGNGTMNHPDLDLTRNNFSPDNNSEWRLLNFNLILPVGSPPGKWGISSIQIIDKAGNFRNYSFVEYIRFDIIESDVVLIEPLKAQILNKYVNKESVDSISVSLSCQPCEGKKYINTIYSLMGGSVVRNEGIFDKDSISIDNLKLSGVLDGVIKLTTQVTDSLDQLIATTTNDYLKDTELPKAYYSQSNLQNEGESNLDDFVVEIVVESIDIGGVYNIEFDSVPNSNDASKSITKKLASKTAALSYNGEILTSTITLNNIDLLSFGDGILKSVLTVTDKSANVGEAEVVYYLKSNGKISLIGNELTDTDDDGVYDSVDSCPNTPTGETVNNDGCSQSQIDDDGDGVMNDKDLCPDTPTGETVNTDGCSQSQIDDDGDGVMNDVDLCPDTPGGETPDANGCSESQLDDDSDGVMNDVDLCPDTPTGETVNTDGCSQSQIDDDGDGVMNDKDLCPDTPIGETVNTDGCSQSQIDDDGDGVMNEKDLCPNTPTVETVNTDGCSQSQIDDDSDGVMNDKDLCPNTPNGETVNTDGCSQSQIDDDGDGVMNDKDLCPDTPAGETPDANGCSESQIDDDGDGIMNDVDLCPDTPVGETPDANGCSQSQIDDDGDGVMNDVDLCLGTPTGETPDVNGCSESQLDDDSDGVMNNVDLCPDTPAGESVNANGCILLGANNFVIESIGETCPDKDNGQLTISAEQNYTYSVTINGASYTMNNTSDLLIDGLSPGAYEVCIEVASLTSPYCYSLNIEEGATVSGKADSDKNKTSVEMQSGTAPFEIFVNGKSQFITNYSNFDIATTHGDLIEVKTAVQCEGVFEKVIQVNDEFTLYPNPTQGLFNVSIPHGNNKVDIEIFNSNSQLLLKKEYSVNNGKVGIDLSDYPIGVYYVKVNVDNSATLRVLKI